MPATSLPDATLDQPSERTGGIARQAIVDQSLGVFGYELFDRSHLAHDHSAASDAQLLFNALTLAETDSLFHHKTLFINCTHDSLAAGHLDLVEAEHVVLEIPPLPLPQVERVRDNLVELLALKRRGFRLAFNYSVLTRSYESWLPLASFIKFDLSVLKPEALGNFVKVARSKSSATLIAEKVETREQYETLRALGVTLFQGYWFAQPVLLQGRTLRPAQAIILQLIDLLRQQASIEDIETLLKRDPALSFNLLRFINSAAFGIRSEVSSFKHAVMLLGYKRLFKWATLLLTCGNASVMPPALGATAVVRGRLMELLAQGLLPATESDDAFVVGVFSLLDAMLGIPLESALATVALPASVCDALLRQSGPLAPVLALVKACESGDATEFSRCAAQLRLDSQHINQAHLHALAWAEQLGSS